MYRPYDVGMVRCIYGTVMARHDLVRYCTVLYGTAGVVLSGTVRKDAVVPGTPSP